VQLKSPGGASVRLSPYGAHVLSWVPAGGAERLYLSPKAEFRPGAPIRGGVPVIFPQFAGLGPLPKHGFARILPWEVAHLTETRAVFWLSENEMTRSLWPHRFLAEYTVRLEDTVLEMSLSVTNTDITPFAFTAALHTYLAVEDARAAAVEGLEGLIYRDSTDSDRERRETIPAVTFPGEVDRIYLALVTPLRLLAGGRTLGIEADGFPDAVIWNPGPEKGAALADLEPDGYRRFVCVEAAAAGQPVSLAPGGIWRGMQRLVA
jgi:glucose-6-phosphate 1-epimerase